jgi:peptidoglycan/LPS O-acetylase OafA/YrhL
MTTESLQVRPMSKHRFHYLDALRGIAAILLLPLHVMQEFALRLPLQNLFLVVDFFFCLSGFVIAFSYEGRLQEKLSLKGFVATRLLRLAPLALLGSGIGLLHVMARAGAWHTLPLTSRTALVVVSLLLLPNYLTKVMPFGPYASELYPFDVPAWSLYFEMVINVTYGLLVRARLAGSVVLAGGAAVCWLYLAYFLHGHADLNYGPTIGGTVVGLARVGFSFFAGVLLYRLYARSGTKTFGGLASGTLTLLLAGVLVFVLLISPLYVHSPAFDLVAITALFPAIVYLGSKVRLPDGCNAVCAFLGDLSYPLYVLHVPLLGALLHGPSVVLAHHTWYRKYFAPVYLALAAVGAWLIQRYVDTPVRRYLSARFNKRERQLLK